MGLGRGFFPANKCVRLNLVNPKGTIVFFMGQNLNAKMYSSWNIGYLRINSQKKYLRIIDRTKETYGQLIYGFVSIMNL
jgi:hypothetical protein